MATYYKHTKIESIDVPYSFRCEQCMKDSGPLKATIKGVEADLNTNFKGLNDKQQQKLDEMAHRNLVIAVKDAYRNATEKQIFDKAFQDECPLCHKPQSWAVSGLKNDMFGSSIVSLIVGLIVAAGCYFFSGVDNALQIAIGAFVISVVIALGFLVFNLARVSSKKKQTSTVNQKNVPVIEWGAVQNLLNEK